MDESKAKILFDERTVAIIRQSVAMLSIKPVVLAHLFYQSLFKAHPALQELFPTSLTDQERKLADTLIFVISGLDRTDLGPAVAALGLRHKSYGAKPEHFMVVQTTLISVLARELASQWTKEMQDAWETVLGRLSSMMRASWDPA